MNAILGSSDERYSTSKGGAEKGLENLSYRSRYGKVSEADG
jgi:hypothetical protein